MKHLAQIGLAAVAVMVVAACARETSPRIVCEVDGAMVPTAFTFDSFCRTVESEHGQIEVQPNASIKSRSLEVYFRPLDGGQLLAERVVWVGTFKHITPAALFGLAGSNAVEEATLMQADAAAVPTNVSLPQAE
ncbi:MAG: hypothetical protein K8T26_04895 [Lentisphaerae bacterium]|nr:hypothetical protein [Lentisphaerota bacterium]